ncbi:MAG: type II toxin-antitoxin system RelE/ParE family toxin [Candidatus Omnitrophota bacterium]|nr:type II toxin-antitoxin system RelE/ParE family toxin [Candidatus Omnitrophota bacterium]
MDRSSPLQVVFYATETGHEPVREWLKSLLKEEKKAIGEDIKTVQFGWPIGMPVVKKLEKGIWEVRTELNNKISRILFTVYEENIVLLHGFIKKSQKTPGEDLDLARKRARDVRGG